MRPWPPSHLTLVRNSITLTIGNPGCMVCRHLEAPDRFRAIQTYRAAMAVMAQQRSYIQKLYNAGVVTEAECEVMEAVSTRSQLLNLSRLQTVASRTFLGIMSMRSHSAGRTGKGQCNTG